MLYRTLQIPTRAVDSDKRTFELSFSSEEPYERYFGTEVLDHKPSSIRMNRLRAGAPVLLNHNPDEQIGVVEKAWLAGSKARATVKLSRGQLGAEILDDIRDGIRSSVSVGYVVHRSEKQEGTDGQTVFRATDWEPLEISIVSIPADTTVGVGRSTNFNHHKTKNIMTTENSNYTEDENVTGLDASQRDAIAERKRVKTLTAMGRKYKLADEADNFIDTGKDVDSFRKYVLDALDARSRAHSPSYPEMPNIQRNVGAKFSICRAVDSLLSKGRLDGFEGEFNQEMERKHRKRGSGNGFYVPSDLTVQKRSMVAGTATAGGNMVQDTVRGDLLIDALRDQLVIRDLGATFLDGLTGNISIPKKTGTAAAQWLGETEEVTKSDQTIGQVSLSPKRVAGETEFSRTLMSTGSPDVENMVRTDLIDTLQLAIDSAIITGTGSSNEPTGILNMAGLATVSLGANGAAPTFDKVVELAGEVANDNAARGQLAYLTNTVARSKLMTTQKFSGTNGDSVWTDAQNDLPGFGRLGGYRSAVSNIVPNNLTKGTGTNLSSIIFGNWSDIVVGNWGGMYVQVDPYSAHSRSLVQIYVEMLMDINIRNEESFAAIIDAVTTI